MSEYVPLHNHTEYSILDGFSDIPGMVGEAARLGLPAISITDHGSLSGIYKFYKECSKSGIKPIIGIEAYVAPTRVAQREPVRWGLPEQKRYDVGGGGKYLHLTLLAETARGIRNLFRLHSESYSRGFYGKPRMDLQALSENSDGILCLSGCLGGPLGVSFTLSQPDRATEWLSDLRDIFGDRLYVEIMDHGLPEEQALTRQLLPLARNFNVPIVGTLDSHYTKSIHGEAHDDMLCIQTKALKAQTGEQRFKFSGSGYHLLSPEEFHTKFSAYPEAAQSTLEIASRVSSYDEVFSQVNRLPSFCDDDDREIRRRVNAWLASRQLTYDFADYYERAEYELDVICSRGFSGYFLVNAHIMEEARNEGILIGPARGSAAGSLVSHALGITGLDPIANGLIFERFINPQRVGYPDLDIDIDQRRRGDYIGIARKLYGEDCVAQVCTFGTIGARSAIRDVVRVHGHPYLLGTELAKQLPPALFGRQPSLSDLKDDLGHPEIIEMAQALEGRIRSKGIHAAAVVIASEPISGVAPLNAKDGVIELDMNDCEALGLLKTDYLGLANLGVIDECVRLIKKNVDSFELPSPTSELNDQGVYELLGKAESTGIFQLDSHGMRSLLRRLHPRTLGDIAAVCALYRPGPMGAKAHTEYVERANGRSPVRYPHDEFESVLADTLSPTYGLIVFQEQVLETLKAVGDYDYSSAALIFDAMRKKDREKLADSEPEFRRRLVDRGYSEAAITRLWDTLLPFADYSFNKSHATGYATISYWTAYLKRHYPREFFTALLTIESDSTGQDKNDNIVAFIRDASRWGIHILSPDVNESDYGWTLTESGIRFGFGSVRGVGKSAFAAIRRERPYRDLDDYLSRVPEKGLNLATLRALAKSGAFDSIESNREGLVRDVEVLSARARDSRDGEARLWTSFRPDSALLDETERISGETEVLGMALTEKALKLRARRFLSVPELKHLNRIVETYPGTSPLTLFFRGTSKAISIGSVNVTERLRGALLALDIEVDQ